MLIAITTSQVITTAKEALITIRKNIITTALKVMVLRATASKVTVLEAIALKRTSEVIASKAINLEAITVLDPADLLTATLDQTTVDFGSKFI